MHGLEAVGQAVGLSVQQLKDFLAVGELCTEIKVLVEKRLIDSVDIVKTIKNLPSKKQKILAEKIVKGKIASKDVRVITTFAKKFPNKSMAEIIKGYEKSKDIRIYVVQISLPKNFKNHIGMRKRFAKIVGKKGIKKLQFKEMSASIELNAIGYKKLRELVSKKETTLRQFVKLVTKDAIRKK